MNGRGVWSTLRLRLTDNPRDAANKTKKIVAKALRMDLPPETSKTPQRQRFLKFLVVITQCP